ncbi:MAG TPA: SAM-dependent methyltransferase [Clostridiales bacterium]|nr:SAM-dependent methyltransferase [Clostridiales bacterium]
MALFMYLEGGMPVKIPLSNRLLACCGYVNPGDRVADVGCDHGYLSIHLLQKGIAGHVYASDVRQGPLGSARRNAANYGLSGKIDFFLCDGVQGLPRDFDVLICAGMGADTMISILEAAPWLQGGNYRLIFQCQSKTPSLRKFFSETGWEITRETALRDGRFLYTVMEVLWNPAAPRLTPGQCYFSPALARCNAPEAAEYRRWVLDLLRLAAKHRPEDEICQALAELEETT